MMNAALPDFSSQFKNIPYVETSKGEGSNHSENHSSFHPWRYSKGFQFSNDADTNEVLDHTSASHRQAIHKGTQRSQFDDWILGDPRTNDYREMCQGPRQEATPAEPCLADEGAYTTPSWFSAAWLSDACSGKSRSIDSEKKQESKSLVVPRNRKKAQKRKDAADSDYEDWGAFVDDDTLTSSTSNVVQKESIEDSIADSNRIKTSDNVTRWLRNMDTDSFFNPSLEFHPVIDRTEQKKPDSEVCIDIGDTSHGSRSVSDLGACCSHQARNSQPAVVPVNNETCESEQLSKLKVSWDPGMRIRPCYILVAFGVLTIICSLIPAIWRSSDRHDISGGFSLAQYILGVGVFVIGSATVIHSKTCTCWG